tara:strand:- start:1083 stop:1718 length:636 start_codon:yes stop_codon:yes gene_type:complete
MEDKSQTEYWVDKSTGQPRYKFNQLYNDFENPWQCEKPTQSDELNNHLFLETIFFGNKKYKKILDIGCGLGSLSNELYKRNNGNVTATDISEVAIDKAKRSFPDPLFKVFDIINNDPYNERFDLIIFSEVLWYCALHLNDVIPKIKKMLYENGIVGIKQDFPNNQKYFREYLNGYDELINKMIESGFNTSSLIISQGLDSKVLLAKFMLVK